MDGNVIKARNLHYTYADGTQALKGKYRYKEGKDYFHLGRKRCGKSTLFLTFNGIHKPSSGRSCITENL